MNTTGTNENRMQMQPDRARLREIVAANESEEGVSIYVLMDALKLLPALLDRLDEVEMKLHSLRWTLGLEDHHGELAQPREESHRNLDALLDGEHP